MTSKQIPNSIYAPDGSLYITLTDGNGNLTSTTGLSATLLWGIYSAVPNAAGIGYVPGDVVTPTGGTTSTLANYLGTPNLVVAETLVVSATVAVAGTYTGTTGNLTVTGTTGTGTKFQASVVATNGSGITSVNSITVGGDYSTNPTTLTAEPVTGSNLTLAQLNVVMGVNSLYTQQTGSYSVLPTLIANAQNTTTGSGTGLTMNLTVLPLSAMVAPPIQDSAFSGILGENITYGYKAGQGFTTAIENCLIGWVPGGNFSSGNGNVIVGDGGVLLTGTCSQNTLIGWDPVRNGTSISGCTALGFSTLKAYSGSQVTAGITAVGAQSMLNWNSGTSTNPSNTCIGNSSGAGASGATYINTTIVGSLSGAALTAATNLVIVGDSAGTKITSGSGTYIGHNVCSTTLTSGTKNIIIGVDNNADTPANNTTNYFGLFGSQATPILAATATNSTPAWTMQGTLNLATGPVLVATPLGLGYATGAGGTVTQITSKSTAVTLNKPCGQITMSNASLGGQSEVSFTLTNSTVAATDIVIVSIASGATANSYIVGVAATAAGSCVIQLGNVTLATALTDAVVLNFAVIKAVTS